MTDYIIPCETVARLANVLDGFPDNASDWCRSIRIDNGIALASNRIIMALENIGGPSGIIHIATDDALVAQCRTEAAYSSRLTVTVVEALAFGTAKTTLGYVHPGNCLRSCDAPNDLDTWRMTVARCKVPAKVNRSGMFWDAANIARLAAASPSGRVVFENMIDATSGERPTLMRDVNDPDWLGVFYPLSKLDKYNPATLPGWLE